MPTPSALTVYQYWLDALNGRNWDEFRQFLAEDATFTFTHLLPSEQAVVRGSDAIVESFQGWQSHFTALPGDITDSIDGGVRAAVQLWWSGSTTTGSSVAFASSHWVTVEDGLITELVDFFDEKGYLEQLDGS